MNFCTPDRMAEPLGDGTAHKKFSGLNDHSKSPSVFITKRYFVWKREIIFYSFIQFDKNPLAKF
jgi:hypothetical protein